MHVHVDEAGRHDGPGCIDDARVGRVGVLDDLADEAVFDDDVTQRIEPEPGVDHAAAADHGLHAGTCALLMRNSSTAMRTNTPLCTCMT